MVYCSECGSKNEEANTFCNTCGSALIKTKYFNIKACNDFNLLLSPQNQKIVKEFSLSVDAYNMIIENIKELGMYNYKEQLSNYTDSQINNMDILSKIALITISFAKINYKSRGAELGSYSFNLINIDDRLDKANQIGTLIHELTHHLVSEIFEQALMYLLEVKKSDALEAFVWFALISSPSSVLMHEYCAHTVQGRFIPHGYQKYGSFNNLINTEFDVNKKNDQDIIRTQLVFGNSIAEDLIKVLEEFITPDLRQEIMVQFKRDLNYAPTYDQILFESKELLDDEVKVGFIDGLLKVSFDLARRNDLNEILNNFKESYSEVNRS